LADTAQLETDLARPGGRYWGWDWCLRVLLCEIIVVWIANGQ
jgi:hypothetical protein